MNKVEKDPEGRKRLSFVVTNEVYRDLVHFIPHGYREQIMGVIIKELAAAMKDDPKGLRLAKILRKVNHVGDLEDDSPILAI